MRSEYRGAQRNQSFDPVLRQTLQLRARMRDFPETLLTGLWIRLRRSMKEERADSRFQQRIDGRVIVARRAIAVAPIQQRRRSAVQLIHSAKQIGDVHVFWLENGSESLVHLFEILQQSPIAGDTANSGMPLAQSRSHETGTF